MVLQEITITVQSHTASIVSAARVNLAYSITMKFNFDTPAAALLAPLSTSATETAAAAVKNSSGHCDVSHHFEGFGGCLLTFLK